MNVLPSFDFWTLCYVWHTRKIIVAKQKNLGREVSKRLFDKTQASGPFFWKLPIFWSDVQHLATQFNLNIWALERPFRLWQKWFESWVGQLIISFEDKVRSLLSFSEKISFDYRYGFVNLDIVNEGWSIDVMTIEQNELWSHLILNIDIFVTSKRHDSYLLVPIPF